MVLFGVTDRLSNEIVITVAEIYFLTARSSIFEEVPYNSTGNVI